MGISAGRTLFKQCVLWSLSGTLTLVKHCQSLITQHELNSNKMQYDIKRRLGVGVGIVFLRLAFVWSKGSNIIKRCQFYNQKLTARKQYTPTPTPTPTPSRRFTYTHTIPAALSCAYFVFDKFEITGLINGVGKKRFVRNSGDFEPRGDTRSKHDGGVRRIFLGLKIYTLGIFLGEEICDVLL